MFALMRTWVLVVIVSVLADGSPLAKPVDQVVNKDDLSTLVITHVIFRHGNRTAEQSELYPKDPYLNFTYYPFGIGQLTNEGKRKEFSIGRALRERYNKFLGEYYYPDVIDAWTTNYNRTKMSLELVLASLFPPRGVEIWMPNYNWQPVPYNYLPRSEDKVLLGTLCPTYLTIYDEAVASEKLQSRFDKHKETFAYISRHTGLNVTTFLQVYNLFFGLSTEEEWGFVLPEWTKKVWPETITKLAIQEYFSATATTDLKRLASGYHLEKIIKDTQTKINNEKEKLGRKIYLYSAHENNVAEMLILLDLFKIEHVPTYGSYLVFEVHKINGTYGFKIYYQNYSTKNIQLLKLPACEEFCRLDKFIQLTEEYIPPEELCGNSVLQVTQKPSTTVFNNLLDMFKPKG